MASSSTSSSRRRFFLKLAAFLVLIVVLDWGVGSLLRHFYFKQKSGLNYLTTYAIQETRDPVIVLGSSRAQAHYNADMIAKAVEDSCFNAGRDGQSLLYAAAVFQSMLARQAPEVVILDLIPADFFEHHGHYDRLSALLPYYRDNEAVRPFVLMRSRYEPIKLRSNIYPFNSLALQIAKYNRAERQDRNGFIPKSGRIKLPPVEKGEVAWVKNDLDERKIKAFRELVAGCLENRVELYVVLSPVFHGRVAGKRAVGIVEEILQETPYRLWDFSDHEDFVGKQEYFRDRGHLNKSGADAYTALLVDTIFADRETRSGEAADRYSRR